MLLRLRTARYAVRSSLGKQPKEIGYMNVGLELKYSKFY